MKFISKVPSLLGEKQTRENRMIGQSEIVRDTGLRRQTVLKWTKRDEEIGNLEPGTVDKWLRYFNCTLNDLVALVESAPSDKQRTSGQG
jgi:hypothetical protein